MRATARPAGAGPAAARGPAAPAARLDARARRGARPPWPARRRACRAPPWTSFTCGATPPRSAPSRARAVQPPEESPPSTLVDETDAYAFDSDTFDEDSLDDIPVGGTVDMDEAETRARGGSWSFRHLEGVMVGAARPLRDAADEVTRWTSSFDDDDEWYKMKPTRYGVRRETDGDETDGDDVYRTSTSTSDDGGEPSVFVGDSSLQDDESARGGRGLPSWLRAPAAWAAARFSFSFGARGWAAREKVRRVAAKRAREREDRRTKRTETETETETASDWRAAAASWIADDDVETFFLSEPDPLGVGAFFDGVGAWAANRRERARAAAAAAATPPPLQVVKLTDADRETLRLGCDEMHFLPVPDSGWSVALLRYRPNRVVHASFSTPCVTSPDAMWDDSDFLRGAGETHPFEKKLPLLLVPGCASNAYTFDVAPSASLARALAKEGHDVFVVECRGVGFSRPWRSPNEWADAKTNTPRQHAPTFGDFDYDTYLREDLPLACGYVAAVVGERKLGAVGHSMGGMLVMNLASGAVEETQTRPPKTRKHVTREGSDDSDSSSAVGVIAAAGEDALPWSPWEISRSVTVASCLECSDVSDGGDGHSSTYARYAAVAGIVPDYLYGGAAIPQLPLGPLSVGQGMAIEAFKGAPSERALESDDAVDAEDTLKKDTETFWERNAVSLSTCYPGATEPALVRRLLYYGFGNVPLRLVLQMATLFAPGGLATREEALARRDRAVRAAEARRRDKQSGFRRFKGWGDADTAIDTDSGDATVEEVVRSSMTGSDSAERDLEKKDEKGTAKELLSHVLYLDALRARRPKLLMLAADCDPVIPPTQVAATARAGGAQYMCFGDGPKRAAGTAAPEGADLKKSDEKKRHRVDGDAALRAMLTDGGEHFSHYDLLCGRRAPTLVFPEVAKFLGRIELFGGRVEL